MSTPVTISQGDGFRFLFCPSNSLKPQTFHFLKIENREKLLILTFEGWKLFHL